MARQLTPAEKSSRVLPGQAFVRTIHGDIPVCHADTHESMMRPIGSSTYYNPDREPMHMDHRQFPHVQIPPNPFADVGVDNGDDNTRYEAGSDCGSCCYDSEVSDSGDSDSDSDSDHSNDANDSTDSPFSLSPRARNPFEDNYSVETLPATTPGEPAGTGPLSQEAREWLDAIHAQRALRAQRRAENRSRARARVRTHGGVAGRPQQVHLLEQVVRALLSPEWLRSYRPCRRHGRHHRCGRRHNLRRLVRRLRKKARKTAHKTARRTRHMVETLVGKAVRAASRVRRAALRVKATVQNTTTTAVSTTAAGLYKAWKQTKAAYHAEVRKERKARWLRRKAARRIWEEELYDEDASDVAGRDHPQERDDNDNDNSDLGELAPLLASVTM